MSIRDAQFKFSSLCVLQKRGFLKGGREEILSFYYPGRKKVS